MLKVNVKAAYREQDQLVVEVQIVEVSSAEGEKEIVLLERKFGYALDVDKKVVAEEMQKFLDTYKSDKVVGEESAKLEAANAKADDTIASLEKLEVTETKE